MYTRSDIFLDVGSPALKTFLAEQRQHRIIRLREMVDRLGELGIVLDARRHPAACSQTTLPRPLAARGSPGLWSLVATSRRSMKRSSVGSPPIGRHSFPAWDRSVDEVIARIHDAGGVASIAHPGLLKRDEWLPEFVESGLDAIEAHSHRSHAGHDGSIS